MLPSLRLLGEEPAGLPGSEVVLRAGAHGTPASKSVVAWCSPETLALSIAGKSVVGKIIR